MNALKQQSPVHPSPSRWAPLALGFRPFFLLAAVAAVLAVAVWPFVWRGGFAPPAHYDPIAWHAHEMFFGYVSAVIAGFLLTAVRNWTGVPTWTGARLGMLALVWLAGRLAPWIPGIPVAVVLVVDVAFLPLIAISLARQLWQGKNRVNRVFLPLLLLMALANLLSHLQLLGQIDGPGDMRRVMLVLVLGLIALVAGRVIPSFTQNALPGFRPRARPWVERLTLVSLALLMLGEASALAPAPLTALLWLLFGASQAVRLGGWFDPRVLSIPVLWVLHVGYAWVVLGAMLTGLAAFGLFPPTAALHALTVGGIGVFTMGMMARVVRGHTGRPIDVTRLTTLAFVAVNLAALIRVFGTAWIENSYPFLVDLSGGLWVFGFALFAGNYVPMLLRARVDGKPG